MREVRALDAGRAAPRAREPGPDARRGRRVVAEVTEPPLYGLQRDDDAVCPGERVAKQLEREAKAPARRPELVQHVEGRAARQTRRPRSPRKREPRLVVDEVPDERSRGPCALRRKRARGATAFEPSTEARHDFARPGLASGRARGAARGAPARPGRGRAEAQALSRPSSWRRRPTWRPTGRGAG